MSVAVTDPYRIYVVAQPKADLQAKSIVSSSSDGGLTAERIVDWPTGRLNAIAIQPNDASSIYGAGDGVFQSTDGGTTWKEFAAAAR